MSDTAGPSFKHTTTSGQIKQVLLTALYEQDQIVTQKTGEILSLQTKPAFLKVWCIFTSFPKDITRDYHDGELNLDAHIIQKTDSSLEDLSSTQMLIKLAWD